MHSPRYLGLFACVIALSALVMSASAGVTGMYSEGSSMDVSQGSMTSGTSISTLANLATTPQELVYHISLSGLNNQPAMGSVSAFGSANLQSLLQGVRQNIQYHESVSVDGLINNFQWSGSFSSGMF